MATESPEAPEGFTQASSPDTGGDQDHDTVQVNRPELGQELRGTLLSKKPDRGDWDNMVIELRLTQPYGDHAEGDLVHCWCTNGIEAALEGTDGTDEVPRGSEVSIQVESTWETDNGDQRRNYSVFYQN